MAHIQNFLFFLIAALVAMVLAIPQDPSRDHKQPNHSPVDAKGFKTAQVSPTFNATANAPTDIPTSHHSIHDFEGSEEEITSEGAESIPHGHSIFVSRPHELSHFSKRGTGGMYECAGKYWRGPCKWTRADDFKCRTRSYTRDSSMGPDKELYCVIYNNWNCQGMGVRFFTYPGIPDFQANGWLKSKGFNSGPLSYQCSQGILSIG